MDMKEATAWRTGNDARGCIRMWPSGKRVNPLAMRPEDLDIKDIAHHLSNECRWVGGCPEHYSVAQHCVLVSRCFDDSRPDLQLAGLLHDAAEAYLKDLPSPIKHDPRMEFYRHIDRDLTLMIFLAFDLKPELLEEIKDADNLLCSRERAAWWDKTTNRGVIPWSQQRARRVFLDCFDEYMKAYTA